MKKFMITLLCVISILTSISFAWTPPIMSGNSSGAGNSDAACSQLNGKAGVVIKDGKPIVCYPTTIENINDSRDRTTELALFITFALQVISVVVATTCLVYGAIMLAIAKGNPHKAQKAWSRIKLALFGVVIMGGLGAIVSIFRVIIS